MKKLKFDDCRKTNLISLYVKLKNNKKPCEVRLWVIFNSFSNTIFKSYPKKLFWKNETF